MQVPALALAALVVVFALPSHAAERVVLDDMTWTEVRDAVKAGSTTAIVPVGGTEQSGPHMALGKHNVRAAALAARIATVLGHTVVAPVVDYVPESAGHMRFPGTISVPREAFEGVLVGAARSLKQAGFRDIVLIGDHGGYQDSLKSVADRLNREWKGAARAHFIAEYYRAASAGFAETLRSRKFTQQQIGEHAGLADTSLMLAVDASRVRADKLASPAAPESATGVSGDPSASTAALGEAGVQLIVERTVQAIREAVAARR